MTPALNARQLKKKACLLCWQLIASPGSLDDVKTREQGMLWVWHSHNQVGMQCVCYNQVKSSICISNRLGQCIQNQERPSFLTLILARPSRSSTIT